MSSELPCPSAADVDRCDVLVAGGPTGSTIGTLLARQGRQVLLMEKEHHPRVHIGESLLPANVPLLEQLGVREQVEARGMPKWGIEFNCPVEKRSSFLEFADAWDNGMPFAWQVRRADFDEILFRNAAREGAITLEGCRVRGVKFDADGADVEATLDDGAVRRWRARYVVDATGRDTLLANQFGWKRKNERHNSAALYGHFEGAQRLEGKQEGNISIFWFPHGWFWFIPLADGSTSVGAVCWPRYLKTRDKPLKEFFFDTIALAPELAKRLQGATLQGDRVWATGNYSYGCQRATGERFLLAGDAYAFIDPVFSSGVYLAMRNAFAGAEAVGRILDRPAEAAAAGRAYERHVKHGPREFSWFIYRMTSPTMRHLFMKPANPMRTKEAVLSLLAGDIYGGAPIGPSLGTFKGVYWFLSLLSLPRAWAAWRARRHNIRDVGALEGENVMPAPR